MTALIEVNDGSTLVVDEIVVRLERSYVNIYAGLAACAFALLALIGIRALRSANS